MDSDRLETLEIELVSDRRPGRRLAHGGYGREYQGSGIGTLVAQATVPNKTALRKPFNKGHLRRAIFDERRGQD